MTLSGNLNSQGAPGEEDEVLYGQRVRALRTPEGFFIAPQSFLPTRRDVKGDVLTIMCEENPATGPVNSRIPWKEHVLKDNKLQVISSRNLPNLDISRSIFLIAQKNLAKSFRRKCGGRFTEDNDSRNSCESVFSLRS